MSNIISLLILAVSLISRVHGAHVKLSVFYETLCPDSRRFIVNQLYPTILELGGVSNSYMEVELVPYGKATTTTTTNGTFRFKCQHGNQECAGNKVHSCALHTFPPADAMNFIKCSMDSLNSPNDDPECASSLGLDYMKIENCLRSGKGDDLLAANGMKTHDLSPKLHYVPWILFDGSFSGEDLIMAERNLLGLLCDKLKKRKLKVSKSLAKCQAKSSALH